MVTLILLSITLFLAAILGFMVYSRHYTAEKRRKARKRRNTRMWKTVFERTDLRRAA